MKPIVIFDAYGTLFKLNVDNDELDSILGDIKTNFFDTWRRKLLEYSWLTSLASQWHDFDTIINKALKFSCQTFDIDSEKVSPILMDIYRHPILFDDAKHLLENNDFTACILSNGVKAVLQNAVSANHIDQRIDAIFSASDVQCFKVSPQLYRLVTSHYNIGPTNILFVSSNSWDITGASMFGYSTVWVNREKRIFDTLVDTPDYVVESLEEIVNLL
ncbi:haloacid dehalogenase type II [Portibacter marinus]|uniref:haloacid dehalogenase type II n=1 Tax=Portibacter marinus TaxID=2898660 RepID=UPI001F291CF8|nr:haloacid dehalogenase type II [Portibacter marinus]